MQANVIQFGVDQLSDASTSEITSFINWCTFSSEFLVDSILKLLDCFILEPHMFGLVVDTTQHSLVLDRVVQSLVS